MKITNTQIKQIIKEELEKALRETNAMGPSYEDELAHMSQGSVSSDYEDEIYNIDKETQENHDAGQVQYLLDRGFTMQQVEILAELGIISIEAGTNKDFNIRTWNK
jgi:hypothetical protein